MFHCRFLALLALIFLGVSGVDARQLEAKGLRVDGRVVDSEGQPMVGAEVNLRSLLSSYGRSMALLESEEPWGESLDQTVTDEDGRYRLVAPTWGLYQVIVEADGFVPAEFQVKPLVHHRILPTVELKASLGRLVEVRDTQGRPAEGALVVLEYHGGSWDISNRVRGWRPAFRLARVEEDGIATVPYLEGETLEMGIAYPGHIPWTGRVRPEGNYCGCDIELKPVKASRTVQVTQGSEPLGGALLTSKYMPVAVANAQGKVELPYTGSASPWVHSAEGRHVLERLGSGDDRLSLSSPSWVSGKVVDADTGRGIPGALVWNDFDGFSIRADENGKFNWPQDIGTNSLSAAYPGYTSVTPRSSTVRHLFKETEDSLHFSLMPERRLRGRVVDSWERGVEDAVVELSAWSMRTYATGPHQRTLTNARGEFELRGPAKWSDYDVKASLLGKVTTRQRVSFSSPSESGTGTLELVLEDGPRLTGRAVDAMSRPLNGVQLDLFGLSRANGKPFRGPDARSAPSASTNGAGRFEVEKMLPGRHALLLRAEGYAPHLFLPVPVGARMGTKDFGDVLLEKEAFLELRFTDAAGVPVPDVHVQVSPDWTSEHDDLPEGLQQSLRQRGKSGENGRLRLAGLRSGQDLALWIRHPEFIPLQRRVQPSSDLLEVTLDAGATLRGRVLDASGQGASSATLRLKTELDLGGGNYPDDTRELSAGYSESDGTFEISGVPEGQVTVLVKLGEYQGGHLVTDVSAGTDVENLAVQLATQEVQGIVLDAQGNPVHDIPVRVTHKKMENHTTTHSARTDVDGRFSFERLPVRVATVTADDYRGRRSQSVAVELGMAPVTLILEDEQNLNRR